MGGFSLQVTAYARQNIAQGEYTIEGEVEECTEGEKYAVLLLKKVTVSDGTIQTEAEGKVKLYVYVSGYSVRTGEVVQGTALLYPAGSAYRYHRFRADMVTGNIRYTASAYTEPESTSFRFHLFAALSERIKETLFDNLDYDEAGAAYAVTTGNTSLMDENFLSSVRYGGVAHLFAVSGMHVGVVFSLVAWSLRKLRMPRTVKSVLPLLVCLLFCGICNFTPSSLRALLVLTLASLVGLFCLRADGVELTAVSALILLVISPANLFSAGFLLSFSAFLGVTVLSPALLRAVKRTGFYSKKSQKGGTMPEKIVKFVVVVLSVQLSIFPVQISFFGYASLWSAPLNCILIPLFSLFFPVLLVGILLSCAFPLSAGVFFLLPSFLLQFFVALFSAADFSSAIVCGFSFAAAGIVAYYGCLFLWSGRCNFSKRGGACLSSFLIALLLVDTYCNGTALSVDCKITQRCYYNDFVCALIETKETTVLVIDGAYAGITSFLYQHTAYLDGVVVVSDDPTAVLNSLLAFPFGDVYLSEAYETGLQTHTVHTERAFSLGKIDFEYTDDGLVFSYDGVKGGFHTDLSPLDFNIFSSEARDGLIFSIKGGILSLSK
jgi:ComEC/Rec2-related protein